MKIVWRILRWFLFRLDPEKAHLLTVKLIRAGIFLGNAPLHLVSGTTRSTSGDISQVFGMSFLSRVGLAAGFDKDAEILVGLPALGFGFAEIGTVTPRPQPGNPRPRLFRDLSEQILFNRMGFNGLGAEKVAERLEKARSSLPSNFRVGVNLGKNKDTSLEKAAEDYVKAARPFSNLADYLVINISSPNTPGLRSLQSIDALRPIVSEVVNLISSWRTKPPLLIKVAPELIGLELQHLVQAAESWGVDGWVLTNTKAGKFKWGEQVLEGGWSGKSLAIDAEKSLIEVRRISTKPIISVGGISSGQDALARRSHGADLIQVYTGWIYQGPTLPSELKRKLREN